MKLFFIYSSISIYSFLFLSVKTHAQNKDKEIKTKDKVLAIKAFPSGDFYTFPNINSKSFYFNEKKRNRIKKLLEENKSEAVYPLLVAYVRQFGIKNFKKDIDLVWKLAEISKNANLEKQYNDLLRLIYRQSEHNTKEQKSFSDSVNENKIATYLPIEEYYALAESAEYMDTLKLPIGLKENMGFYVNSSASDYAPFINQTNNTLIFTSQRHKKNGRFKQVANEELFFSKNSNDDWTEAKTLEGVNSLINEGSACLSANNKTLYFSRCNNVTGFGNCDLYSAKLLKNGKWGNIENLGSRVNSSAWDSHPNLSSGGDTLYFASSRIGGFGYSDIYFTTKNNRNEWSSAQNIGAIINTKGNEVSPFFDSKKNILYFSSESQIPNFGEYDIYKSRKIERGNWETPRNVGPLVNGKYSEFYFTIDQKFEKLYYAKSIEQDLQNLDIYSYKIPMGAHPDANTSFSGSLKDSDSQRPLDGIVAIIDLDEGTEIAPKFLEKDGSFDFDLINKRNYLMVIHGDEYFRIEKMFYLDGNMQMHQTTVPISRKIKFESIEFENGKSDLQPQMYTDLSKVARFLQDNSKFKLIISGHTDSQGNAKFNLDLSQKRADAIKEYLVHFASVPKPRVIAKGYGSKKPIISPEKNKEDRKINRRVEFEIYQPNKEELEQMERELDQLDDLNDW